jgi:hypothetical protein
MFLQIISNKNLVVTDNNLDSSVLLLNDKAEQVNLLSKLT